MTKRRDYKNSYEYEIESVRVPKERIQMYKKGSYVGSNDIALIKLKTNLVFVPNKIMPVSNTEKVTSNLKKDLTTIFLRFV